MELDRLRTEAEFKGDWFLEPHDEEPTAYRICHRLPDDVELQLPEDARDQIWWLAKSPVGKELAEYTVAIVNAHPALAKRIRELDGISARALDFIVRILEGGDLTMLEIKELFTDAQFTIPESFKNGNS